MSTAAAFLSEVPGWFLWTGVFFPVTALLLLLLALLGWKLRETEEELAATPDPRRTAIHLCYGPHRR
ncbi:small leucine-rich protein 1-like [Onychostoma macrolepis]|uniref:Small leucine rich protein 1 n=1 Tax=Onychostoma macrolepis TaxID=369639 RepID=A0A7J6BWE3_9TELE|nr:small leucine-rich protein 1-like [Onychostoma macrolepis]KAF4099154.1 hypothetical protein G5714_019280 [Onychostoma macrolepis]